ncbi:MAG: hypothetical protein K0R98_1613 [Rickettsiaceae bacterium]|jgi:hypothetical protein|nr:hypothetical protein [Gammaproteobacteria bacterium]MCE3233356.1 hypothetical protein [Rickettsiaceae bacterium]
MNIVELKSKLVEAKINPYVYCINCKHPMEAL